MQRGCDITEQIFCQAAKPAGLFGVVSRSGVSPCSREAAPIETIARSRTPRSKVGPKRIMLTSCQPAPASHGSAPVVSSFETLAIVQAKCLPSGGKPGRKNWRLRSLRGTQFHSTAETSGAGSDEPTHDGPLPANAEMICAAPSVGAEVSECSCATPWRDRQCPDVDPRVAVSEFLLLVR